MALQAMFGDVSESDSESETETQIVCKKSIQVKKRREKSLCPVIDISHITKHEYNHLVYEPGSDSFLLMDCIEDDGELFDELFKNKDEINVMEIGCGSGIVLCHTYHVLKTYVKNKKIKISLFGVDINENALRITKNTLINNGIKQTEFTLIQCNLLDGIKIDLFDHQIDILLFNPPYVPTTNEELSKSQKDKSVNAACAGGIDGRVIIDEFIQGSNFHRILSKKSFFYLVTIALNKPNEIIKVLKQPPYNLNAEIVARKRVVGEMLNILRVSAASTVVN